MAQKGTDVTSPTLDRERTREAFEGSTDFTVGLEEEFALARPSHARAGPPLRGALRRLPGRRGAGGLGRGRADRLRDRDPLGARRDVRRRRRGAGLSTATALFAAGRGDGDRAGGHGDPSVGELPRPADHRHRALQPAAGASCSWVAQRNNTWSLHVHMGVRGADRAIAVCDHLRGVLPAAARRLGQLALPRPAATPGWLGPHRDLHPHLPALRRPRAVRRLRGLRGLHRHCSSATNSVVESTQLWWSVRPHHTLRHGRAADLRRADAAATSRSRSPA